MSCYLFAAAKKQGIAPKAGTVPKEPVQEISHVVRKGETLSSIAGKYKDVTYQEIAQANNIANPNNIYVGQRLKIPNQTLVPKAPKTPKPNPQIKQPSDETSTCRPDRTGCGECKPITEITSKMIKIICPKLSDSYINKIIPYLNMYAKKYHVNNTCRVAHFLSQIGHESCFKVREENLHFTLKRAKQIWSKKYHPRFWINPSYFTQKGSKFVDPKKYANYIYGNRRDLGNGDEKSGDGYKYIGRGLIQLTGKSNYSTFTRSHNSKNPQDTQDFVKHPHLLTKTQYGIESAFWFWDKNRLNKLADQKEKALKSITRRINGGYNGLADRKHKFEMIMKYLEKN